MDIGETPIPSPEEEYDRNITLPTLSTIEAGTYQPSDIIFERDEEPRPMPEDLKQIINDTWDIKTTLNPKLYNAPKFDIRSVKKDENGKLHFTYGLTDYKTFVGTRDEWVEQRYPESVPRLLSVAVVTETKDGDLIMHQRSQDVFHYKGWVSGLGGNVEAPNPEKEEMGHTDDEGNPNPFQAAKEEMYEESGIPPEHVTDLTCHGFVKNGKRGFGVMMFRGKTDLTREEIENLTAPHADEGSTLIISRDKTDFHKLLGFNKAILHDSLPVLLYIGRERYGKEWYERMLKRLDISQNSFLNLANIEGQEETIDDSELTQLQRERMEKLTGNVQQKLNS